MFMAEDVIMDNQHVINEYGKAIILTKGMRGSVFKPIDDYSDQNGYENITADFKIDAEFIKKKNIHVHVPEGATPKDGPSAGITILSSLISTFTGRRIRNKIAMSGEITLRGKLLPVGGLNEKVLAAKRAGIYDIVLSSDNKKDIDEIDKTYIENMRFHYFDSMKEAIDYIVLP